MTAIDEARMNATYLLPEQPAYRLDVLTYGKHAAEARGWVAGQVEVTSRCFQHCRGCESWRDDATGVNRGDWTLEELQQFVCQLEHVWPNFEHLSLTGGDPQAWEPLPEFLGWWHRRQERRLKEEGRSTKLQLNTALVRDLAPDDGPLWREAVDDLRVSLDGISPEVYQYVRGDKKTHPEDVLRRMWELRHPRTATNTTVMPANIQDLRKMLDTLEDWHINQNMPLRKAMFLAVLGPRMGDLQEGAFWQTYRELGDYAKGLDIDTSFAEDVRAVRDFTASAAAIDVPCYSGMLSFHVKADGLLYPCCLVGGEAIETHKEMAIGNVHEESVEDLYARTKPECHYGDPKKPCSNICQWKQLQVNLAGHLAAGTTLSMP